MIYTRRQVRKKLVLVLVLGVLLGWCAHVLTVQAVIYYHQRKPVVLGVAHAEKAQIYRVFVSRFSGVPAPPFEFSGGKALWTRPGLIKTLFIARFKPSPAYYTYLVVSPDGKQKRGRFYVGKNANPGK